MLNRLPLPTVEVVRFEIVGDGLDPAAVTAALRLQPDATMAAGPCPPELIERIRPMLEGLIDALRDGSPGGVVPDDARRPTSRRRCTS